MNKYFIDDGLRIKRFEPKEVDGETVFFETDEWADYKRKKKLESFILAGGLPNYIIDLNFDSIVRMQNEKEKLKKYVLDFSSKYKHTHLYFWSSMNGTQKTTTATILAKEILLKGFSIKFILMSDLSKLLTKEAFADNADSGINEYLECDFLVIDDSFDPKKVTVYKSGYQVPFLDTFLRKRLEIKQKATCFTANIAIDDIDEKIFGVSLKKLITRAIIDPWEFNIPYSLRNDFDIKDLWS